LSKQVFTGKDGQEYILVAKKKWYLQKRVWGLFIAGSIILYAVTNIITKGTSSTGNFNTTRVQHTHTKQLYTVKLSTMKAAQNITQKNNWFVSGTTQAPDGAKILAIEEDDNDSSDRNNSLRDFPLAAASNFKWSVVKNGKFSTYVSLTKSLGLGSTQLKTKIHIVALPNYDEDHSSKVPVGLQQKIRKTTPFEFSANNEQAHFLEQINNQINKQKSKMHSTQKPTKVAEQANPITLKPGKYLVGKDVKPGRYVVKTNSSNGELDILDNGKGRVGALLVLSSKTNADDGHLSSFTTDLISNATIEGKRMGMLTLIPVTKRSYKTTLSAGNWQVGKDIQPGTYTISYIRGIGIVSTTKSGLDTMMGKATKSLEEHVSVTLIKGETLSTELEQIKLKKS